VSSEGERVIDAQYVFNEGEDQESLKKNFYRTKDKYIAAFLRARGYVFRGMEKVQLQDTRGRRKSVIRFCFDGGNVTRRALFEFYNTDDHKTLTVNAKLILQELKNVNSLIGNF
jgi:hypothetical protein